MNIKFDIKKLNKEGITVLYRNGEKPRIVENWKDIVGCDGRYRVSDCGRVMSVGRVEEREQKGRGYRYTFKGRVLVPAKTGPKDRKYYSVNINRNGKMRMIRVNRLVAEHFIDNPGNKPQVNHKDGDKFNNHVSNLEWVTASENLHHCFTTGLFPLKLSAKDVVRMEQRRSEGITFRQIGKEFGISERHAHRVITGKIPVHVKS